MKKTILLIQLFIAVMLPAENSGFSVSGKINISLQKSVYIYLVDEESLKIPFTGFMELKIMPEKEDLHKGFIFFEFNNVPAGIYGIRIFQDKNENGKLDKGLFGPTEPWGLSWNDDKYFGWPKFNDYCFAVSADKKDLVIGFE